MSYPKRGISVDIGNEKIKVAEYQRAGEKVKIKRVLIIDTPENCINDGVINDVSILGEMLKAEFKENKIRPMSIVFTVSSSKIITREVEMPDLPVKKLDTLIKLNAEEYFPVDLTEYTVDYSIIDKIESENENQVKVNIIAALTTMVESYVDLANYIGFKNGGIDYSGNSILNFAKHIKEERTYMLLDLGSESTMVTIMNQGKLKFSRNLMYGTRVISNSIQNHFGVDYKEAMKISLEQSLLTHTPEGNDFLSSDVSASLNQILNGISRLVDYYTSRNKDGIDKIILVGGGTSIKGIDEYIADYFNIKTKILDAEDIDLVGEPNIETQKVFLANAVGAIYSDVNLMPASIAELSKARANRRLQIEIGVLFLALACFAVYFPYADMKAMEVKRNALHQEVQEKQVVTALVEEHTRVKKDAEFYRAIMTSSSSTTEIVREIIIEMEKVIPTDIEYMAISNAENAMTLTCITDTKLDIVQFQKTLKALSITEEPVFSDVYIPNITAIFEHDEAVEPDYLTFSVVCTYKVGEVQDEQ